MKSFKSALCAVLLALAVSSSAFAGNITGKAPGNITGRNGNITGAPGNITGEPEQIDEISVADILSMILWDVVGR